jgi:hypothetical protein
MAGPFITRDFEIAAQLEAAYNTSPGALAGGDFFKSRTKFPFKRVLARLDRDSDMDNGQASVVTTQKGRESSTFSVSLPAIPSGNAATPTEPDADVFFEAHFGQKHKALANTTLAAGSTASSLNLAVGGGAATGVQIGDIIVVDVSAAFGLEARQVTSVAGDVVGVDRPLSAAPAAARVVTLGTTYRYSSAQLKSVHIWGYLNGDNFRHKTGGNIVKDFSLDLDFNNQTPEAMISLAGDGSPIATHATARPTPVTAGQPLAPSAGKVWVGSALGYLTKFGFKSNNGLELRQSTSESLIPTGIKRTGNKSRFSASAALDLLLTTGAVEGYFDNAANLTAYDVIVQLGVTPGQMVIIRMPKLIPDVDVSDVGEEVALSLAGKLYATTALDDEATICFA